MLQTLPRQQKLGLVRWPNDISPQTTVVCVVCGDTKAITEVTAGLHDAENNQAFVCNGHFWNGRRLIFGWVDFITSQRRLLSEQDAKIASEWW